VSDVVAEADLENVAASDDDRMSRRQLVAGRGDRVVRDQVKDDVNLRQVRVACDVNVSSCQTGTDCAM